MSAWDMHRVAMTRKPVQCLAPRAVCNVRQPRVTPNVPGSRTFGDVATAELAWWGASPPQPDVCASSSEPTAVVGCGMLCGARHFLLQRRPLRQGGMRWGMHGQCDLCAEPGTPAESNRQAIRPGADVEFVPIWAELLLSRLGVEREHRRQANPHAARLKCTVSQPACPLPYSRQSLPGRPMTSPLLPMG